MFHQYSAARNGNFVKVNCPAIPGKRAVRLRARSIHRSLCG
jgi:DNA-binding NtrC family response regulator